MQEEVLFLQKNRVHSFINELPRPKATRYQAEENIIFSLMKTLGFQTFLLTTDAEHRGIPLIKI